MILNIFLLLELLSRVGGDPETPGDMFPRTEVVETKKGLVQGRSITLREGEFHLDPVDVFLGIPYALPPVGPRRFTPSAAHPPWSGVLQAISYGPACPQQFPADLDNKTLSLQKMTRQYWTYLTRVRDTITHEAEDCLYLNIFRPNNISLQSAQANTRKPKLAVLVFVHGESWSWGSSALYDARILATLGRIIVVTFNYRLGVFGFLNTNPSPMTKGSVANYGLVDQMAALQWVVENIEQFGGDPNRITLMGQGVGAASVEYLVHSPMIRQSHFQRVILMSGSMFSTWARMDNPSDTAVKLARELGCPLPADLYTHHSNILDCLREKPVESLTSIHLDTLAFQPEWGPSFDGITVKNNFVEIKGKRSFDSRSYDALVGVTSHDWFHHQPEESLTKGISKETKEKYLRSYILNNYENHLKEIFLAVNNEYSEWDQIDLDGRRLRDDLVTALSDAMFLSPAVHSAGTFSRRRNNTYFFHFAHQTKSGMYMEDDGVGGSYGQELDYVFGLPISGVWPHVSYHYTRAEVVLSAIVISYWANFVKDGNPNYPLQVEQVLNTEKEAKRFKMVNWEPFNSKKKYLEIDLKPRMKENYRSHAAALWLNLVPQLENSGSYDSWSGQAGPHGMLTGATWGLVRNRTSVPGVQQISLGDKVNGASCQGGDGEVTSGEPSTGKSQLELNNVILVSLVAGTSLFVVNTVILVSLCYKRTGPHRPRWDRAGDNRVETSSTECLNNVDCGQGSQPTTPHMLPSFNTPGRTSTIHRQQTSSQVPLSSFPKSVHEYGGAASKYRTYSSGGSYVGIPPPSDSASSDFSVTVPLVADIPAPGQFGSGNGSSLKRNLLKDDSITC